MITSARLYNFREKKGKKMLKRAIPISSIGGVSKSLSKKSNEFVIHVPEQYDYRYQSENRDEIIQSLKMAFISLMKSNLPIYGIDTKDLKNFTTTEKDKIKGKSRIPDKKYLMEAEEISIKEENSENPSTVSTNEWDTEDYLKTSFRASAVLSSFQIDLEDEEEKLKESQIYRSSTLYSNAAEDE